MTVVFNKADKEAPPATRVFCYLYHRTQVLDDGIVEPWSPTGCHKSVLVDDVFDLPLNWNVRDGYVLCPPCDTRFRARFETSGSLSRVLDIMGST